MQQNPLIDHLLTKVKIFEDDSHKLILVEDEMKDFFNSLEVLAYLSALLNKNSKKMKSIKVLSMSFLNLLNSAELISTTSP